MHDQRTLGEVIRQRRKELGLTQARLAERISAEGEYLEQSDISRLERGKVGLPRRKRLERIAAALGLTTGELLARSGWVGADEYLPLSSAGEGSEPPLAGAPSSPAPPPRSLRRSP